MPARDRDWTPSRPARQRVLAAYQQRVAGLADAEQEARAGHCAREGRRVLITGLRYYGLQLTGALVDRRPCRTYALTLKLAARNYARAVAHLPPTVRAHVLDPTTKTSLWPCP